MVCISMISLGISVYGYVQLVGTAKTAKIHTSLTVNWKYVFPTADFKTWIQLPTTNPIHDLQQWILA